MHLWHEFRKRPAAPPPRSSGTFRSAARSPTASAGASESVDARSASARRARRASRCTRSSARSATRATRATSTSRSRARAGSPSRSRRGGSRDVLQKRSVPFGARERRDRRRPGCAPRAPPPAGSSRRAAATATRRAYGPPGALPGDVLERARVLVDVDEVEERLQQVLVVVVAVPALRGDARRPRPAAAPSTRRRRTRASTTCRDTRSRRRACACDAHSAEPRVVGPELDAVAVQPHDELLAGARRGAPRRRRRGRPRSRRRSGRACCLELCQAAGSGKSSANGSSAVAVARELGDDRAAGRRRAPASSSAKCRRLARFERTRSCSSYVARMPRRSSAVATWLTRAANLVFVLCTAAAVTLRACRSVSVPRVEAEGLRRSIRDSPLRRAALCAAARRPRAVQPLRARRARARGFEVAPQPRARLGAALGARGRAGRTRPGARLRGGYGATSRSVLACSARLNRPTSSSRPSTPSASRSCCSPGAGVVRPPLVYAAIGLPERLEQLRRRAHARLYRRRVSSPATDRRLQRARGGRAAGTGSGAGGAAGRSSCRSASTPSASGPTGRLAETRRRLGRRRPAPRLRCSSRSRRADARVGPSASSRPPTTRARSRAPANVARRARPPVRRDARAARARPGSSPCPSARTATRARRRSCSRRWRSGSRWSSRGRPRSRAATTSRTASNCGSSRPGTLEALERARSGAARRRRARRGRSAPERARPSSAPHLGAVRERDRELLLDGLPPTVRVTVPGSIRRASSRVPPCRSARSGARVCDRGRPCAVTGRRGARRHRALPRVRSAADRRRSPVPARARRASSSAAGSPSSSNRISRGTPACLFNSFNFDFRRLRRFARDGLPDGAPRRRADRRLPRLRRRHRRPDRRDQPRARRCDVVQSRYSLEAHRELGIELGSRS